MKKKLKIGICACIMLSILTSCNQQTSHNSSISSIDYSRYSYSFVYGSKGAELYCWKINHDSWRCGVLIGTNIAKSFEEFKEIQDIYPCPLDTMKTILSTYPDEARKSINIRLLPYPIKEDSKLGEFPDEETLAYLKGELGLE